ncbi:hypothetical protein SEA_BRUHMOMENT_23 [Arthrobacter phage BruhMoment]|nr:hypothetical protein SEA_BRUHMOMENT_23 [Arthrobacter phage BruhMoment]
MSFSFIPQLADGESYVKGRSQATAAALIEAAGDRTAEVRTTSHGYIVPSGILSGEEGYEVYTSADRPAVPTEPDTSTNVGEVYNVGQAPTGSASEELPETPDTPGNDEVPNPPSEEEPANEFDPSKATVDEVIEYLKGADEEEVQRVLAAEAAGKGRKTVADYDSEGAK